MPVRRGSGLPCPVLGFPTAVHRAGAGRLPRRSGKFFFSYAMNLNWTILSRVLRGCSGLVAGRAMRGLERQARGGLRPVSLRKILSDGCADGPLCFFEKDAPGRSGRRVVVADLLQPAHDRLAFDRQLEQGAEVAPKPVRGDQRLDVLRVEVQIDRDASPAVVLLDASVVSAVQSGRAVPVFEAEGERLVARRIVERDFRILVPVAGPTPALRVG